MTGGNPFYDAFFDDLISQFPAGPLADRTTALAGGLTSQGHDLANLLWGEREPQTRRIPQPFFYTRSSRMAACSPSQRLRQNRTVSTSRPTSRAIWLVQASRGRQNDSASPGQLLGGAYRRTRVSNPCCSSGDNSTTGGFGPRIAFTTTLHLSNGAHYTTRAFQPTCTSPAAGPAKIGNWAERGNSAEARSAVW